MSPAAIRVDNALKRYGSFEAVKGISLEVAKGEILGLLGPNGAGKSTLIRMMTALTPITEGEVLIDGCSVRTQADQVRQRIGVLPQAMTSDVDLTVEENLSIYAKLYGLDKALRQTRIDALLEAVDLIPKRKAMVKTLSGGMRRRLEIARGLIHAPQVFFLDEPTTGLDPVSRTRVWELLQQLNQTQGITMLITTHHMEEADFLCDRIAIVDRGTLIALDTAEQLKQRVPGGALVEARFAELPEGWISQITELPDIRDLQVLEDGTLRFRTQGSSRTLTELVERSVRSGVALTSISVKPTTLDDVFVHFTGHLMQDKAASKGVA